MRRTAVFFLALAISFVSIGGAPFVHASGSATMTLSPETISVETGDTFTITVLVDPNGESLDTARVDLSYSASMLEATWFELGSQFPSLSPGYDIDNSNGELTYGAFKYGTQVSSSGTFATMTFHALSAGEATIELTTDSKLIDDGSEKIDTSSLNTVTVTVSGDTVEAIDGDEEEEEEEETTPATSAADVDEDSTDAEMALVYFGALAGSLPSTDADWAAHQCMIDDSCYPGAQDLDKEVQALGLFSEKYGSLPISGMEWNVIHAVAYTNVFIDWGDGDEEEVVEEEVTEEEELSLEAQALVYFGAFYGRMPANGDDWDALHCFAYGGCQGDPQDVAAEEAALVIFGAKYATMPSTTIEWNVIHTLAYTDFLDTGEEAAEEEVVEEEEVIEEVVEEVIEEEVIEEETELTDEQMAIGYYGALTGELPSDDAGWLFVDYVVNGYDGEADADLESQALGVYTGTFGQLPSTDSDWNLLKAIAYSGAIL